MEESGLEEDGGKGEREGEKRKMHGRSERKRRERQGRKVKSRERMNEESL